MAVFFDPPPLSSTTALPNGVTATTQSPGDNTTKVATDAFVTAAIAVLAPASATWTPTDQSGAGLTFSTVSASYTKIGNMVFAYFFLAYPVTVNASTIVIGGLPVAIPNQTYAYIPGWVDTHGGAATFMTRPVINSTTFNIVNSGSGALIVNSNLSATTISAMIVYPAA